MKKIKNNLNIIIIAVLAIGLIALGLSFYNFTVISEKDYTKSENLRILKLEEENNLRLELDDIIEQYDNSREEIDHLNVDLDEKQSEINKLKSEIRDLLNVKHDLKEAKKKIISLQNISKKYFAQVDSLLGKTEELQLKNNTLIEENSEIKTKNQNLNTENTDLNARLDVGSTLEVYAVEIDKLKYSSHGQERKVIWAKNIQVLRFIAAFSVMMVHLPVFEFGAWGVDIFFVISGFIMMYITEHNNKNFLIKRIIRIVPLYWLLTLTVFLIAFLEPEILNNTTANFEHLLKSLFFIPFNKNETGHFPILFLGWTLNYEIIFYILFAFTIVIFKRFRLMISSFLIIFFLGINYFFSEHTFINSTYSNTIMFEFIYGMFIFLIWQRFKNNSPPSNFNKAIVTLLLICMIIFFGSLEVSRAIKWGVPSSFLVLYFLITLGNLKFPKVNDLLQHALPLLKKSATKSSYQTKMIVDVNTPHLKLLYQELIGHLCH